MSANPINYVLIDYENVQPKDFNLLKDGSFKIKVFLGPNQAKIPLHLVTALQPLGINADYVSLEATGSNALDFHIAFYIGKLSCQEPSAHFHIISKDQGFDPLIKYLRGKDMLVERTERIADMSCFKHALPTTIEAQIGAAVTDLVRRNSSKPRTEKTLRSTLHALFKKEASEEQLSNLIHHLRERGIVRVEGGKVSYRLPVSPA